MMSIDVTNIPLPDSSFDVIICNHVLEHVHDDRKAMREFYRTLRPGGWAVLQVPISYSLDATYEDFSIITEEERERAFGQYDHVRIYADDYVSRLKEAGFEVRVFGWTDSPEAFGHDQNLFALNPDEKIYIAVKSCL